MNSENNDTCSMVDILNSENQQETDADAVLGPADDCFCTYKKGYLFRQPLYSCATCTPNFEINTPGGICLACSLSCHDGHQLYELYTKRNFCCDCGTAKCPTECKLESTKNTNSENSYNQNFRGLYCTCHRPYPDPDNDDGGDMIQCCVCEDWFHEEHLGLESDTIPASDDFSEMVCSGCAERCGSILRPYAAMSEIGNVTISAATGSADEPINVETSQNDAVTDEDSTAEPELKRARTDPHSPSDLPRINIIPATPDTLPATGEESTTSSADAKKSITETPEKMRPVIEGDACYLRELKRDRSFDKPGALFMSEGWRAKLCRCVRCLTAYNQFNIAFLTDEEDTVAFYESQRKDDDARSETSLHDRGLEALQGMDHTAKMGIIQGYNDMKTELMEHLAGIARENRPVTETDIREFFAQLKAKRSADASSLTTQHFCR